MKRSSDKDLHTWRFLTNHAHVLVVIAADPTIRLKDIAAAVGITERAVAQTVRDLEEAGYVTKTRDGRRDGRRNAYVVHEKLALRHARHGHRTVGELIRFLEEPPNRS